MKIFNIVYMIFFGILINYCMLFGSLVLFKLIFGCVNMLCVFIFLNNLKFSRMSMFGVEFTILY